jgi:hypothetical protein
MKTNMNDQKTNSLCGIQLNRKRFYYFLILDTISYIIFFSLMWNALQVLVNAVEIQEISFSLYYNVIILGFSNLAISLIFLGIGSHALKRLRLFKKSLNSH